VSASSTDYALAQKQYALGNNEVASQLAAKSVAVNPNDQQAALLRQRALLFSGAIEEQKHIDGAVVVQQDLLPVTTKLDSGELRTYLVQWIATIGSHKTETGHPSEPLNGWFTDTRQCHWEIRTEVHRTVYFLDPQGKLATAQSASSVFSGGFNNQGSDFVFQNLRPENCGDAAARYDSDLKNANSTVGTTFAKVVREDQRCSKVRSFSTSSR